MHRSFSTLLLMASFWWICRYGAYDGNLASHILLSQRPDPKEKQVINLDQDVQVCENFWWMVYELLCMHHLSFFCFFLDKEIFFSFFFFFTCLSMWHAFFGYASFISFFFIARILDGNLEKESHVMAWSFIECMDGCACYLPVWKYSM